MKVKMTSCRETLTTSSYPEMATELIKLAARFCESHASDIIYDLTHLSDFMQEQKIMDELLLFRETGVTSLPVVEEMMSGKDGCLFLDIPDLLYHRVCRLGVRYDEDGVPVLTLCKQNVMRMK